MRKRERERGFTGEERVHEDAREDRVCLEAGFTTVTATSTLLVMENFCKSPVEDAMRCRISRVAPTRDKTRRRKAVPRSLY